MSKQYTFVGVMLYTRLMLLGLLKNVEGCVLDPLEIVHFRSIRHEYGNIFGVYEQYSIGLCGCIFLKSSLIYSCNLQSLGINADLTNNKAEFESKFVVLVARPKILKLQ